MKKCEACLGTGWLQMPRGGSVRCGCVAKVPVPVPPSEPQRELTWPVPPAVASIDLTPAPVDMILFCPECDFQHVDAVEFCPTEVSITPRGLEMGGTVWRNPPHRSHLCKKCGCIWRPADVPTNGVREIKTRGKRDTWKGGTK